MLNAEQPRWLDGVPGEELEAFINAAPGNEIATGQFDNPMSSSRLAANAFGYFFNRPGELADLPGCEEEEWPALSLAIEKPVGLPREVGRHSWLDALIETPSALIGVESKRYETFFGHQNEEEPIEAHWLGDIWGNHMAGYQAVRDQLMANPNSFQLLDAFQLIRHALALRTEANLGNEHRGLSPILFYVYAEPPFDPWGTPVHPDDLRPLKCEIDRFSKSVQNDEVRFVPCSYRQLLWVWGNRGTPNVRIHAENVQRVFTPC